MAQSGYQANAPWPKYGANNGNTGIGAGQGATGLVAWRQSPFPYFLSGPSIDANGILYICAGGTLYAYDSRNGAEKWELAGVSGSAPAIGSDGTLFVGTDDGFSAIDSSAGSIKWTIPTTGGIESGATIDGDGTVYVATIQGYLYAVDGATGAQVWSFQGAGNYPSTPALDSFGNIYLAAEYLYSLDASTGHENWQFRYVGPPQGDDIEDSVCVAPSGTVYCGGGMGMYALEPQTGAMLWRFQANNGASQFPGGYAIGPDGTVYTGTDQGQFFALDGSSGVQKWVLDVDFNQYATPAIDSAGVLYIPTYGSENLGLYAVDSASGKVRWNYPCGDTFSPALDATGNVYVGSDAGILAFGHIAISRFYLAAPTMLGGGATRGVLQFSASGPLGFNGISMSSSSPDVQIPSSVSVPEGSFGVSFPVTTRAIKTPEVVTLTASAGGTSSQTTVQLNPAPIYNFYTAAPFLAGGNTMNGVVQIPTPAPSGGTQVSLFSGTGYLVVPPTVTVPAGSTGVSFPIASLPVNRISNLTLVAGIGSYSKDVTVEILPNYVSSFYVSPSTVVIGATTYGVVQLGGRAGPGGQIVTLQSLIPNLVPASVTVPAGSTGVSFPIDTAKASYLDAENNITASCWGTSKNAILYSTAP